MADFQLSPDRTHAVDAPTKITPAGRRAPGPGDAGGLLRLQATAGNHAVQRLITGKANAAAVTIQRVYIPTIIQTKELNDLIRRNWISQADLALLNKVDHSAYDKTVTWTVGEKAQASTAQKRLADKRAEVTKWCKSQKQFTSLVNNMTWADFESLRTENPRGVEEGGTAAILKRQELERLEHLRTTGKCGPGRTYGTYLTKLTVTHERTFRTDPEKKQGQPKGAGPFTRNFAIHVDKKAALWEIHVHYADNGTPQKAHAKLITQRTTHEHIADLTPASVLVKACKVLPATDATARANPGW